METVSSFAFSHAWVVVSECQLWVWIEAPPEDWSFRTMEFVSSLMDARLMTPFTEL